LKNAVQARAAIFGDLATVTTSAVIQARKSSASQPNSRRKLQPAAAATALRRGRAGSGRCDARL